MSVNYQTDSYILHNDTLCNNQLKHQELLVATLKQLAEENKRLLKEREQFDDERLHRKSEINALKKNFIHLFTISQYEFNKSKFIESEFINESKTYDIITKRSEINQQTFESINLLQELKIEFIYQLVKNNCKNIDYFHNCNNTFDCRPYKGPKTPPTPSSKYRYNEAIVNKVHQNINCQTKLIDSWSVQEMVCYLKKYKELFKIYNKSINQMDCLSNNKMQFQTNYNNMYDPNVFEKSKYGNEKCVSNDMKFYQELIEKHKKSLKMIENVGNRILPNLDLSEINTMPKDNAVHNHISELFNMNNIRNQIFNDFTSKLILENSIALSNSKCLNDTMAFNETLNMKAPHQFSLIDSFIKTQNKSKDNIESENKELKIQEIDFKYTTTENEIITNLKENVDSPKIFEDGEIIDSGDEVSDKKTILKSDKITIINDKEKTNNTSNKASIKSMSSKFKKPIGDSKHKNNLTSVYSKYHRPCKIDKNKPNKIIKTCQSTFNENRNFKRESTRLPYYNELKTRRYCKDDQKTNPRNEFINYERWNRYFRHTRHFTPKY